VRYCRRRASLAAPGMIWLGRAMTIERVSILGFSSARTERGNSSGPDLRGMGGETGVGASARQPDWMQPITTFRLYQIADGRL
jgi:hypothetical protein